MLGPRSSGARERSPARELAFLVSAKAVTASILLLFIFLTTSFSALESPAAAAVPISLPTTIQFVKPMNTYAVVGVGVLRYLEHIVRSSVVKFHDQSIRREDV